MFCYNLEPAYQHQIKGTPTLNLTGSQMIQKEDWSPSIFCGMDTPPPQEVVPNSIPQTPNSQVNFCYKSFFYHRSFPHNQDSLFCIAATLQSL
jgi:hypothetical protein